MLNSPPIVACQIFVTKDGAKIKTIEVGKFVKTVKMARLIDERPHPITPLTNPPIRKVPKMTMIVEISNFNR